MTELDVKYRGIPVPTVYHNNLDSREFTHWKSGVDAAQGSGAASDEYEYFTDGDAPPYTYYRRFKPDSAYGDFLGGSGGSWRKSEDMSREEMVDDYGYYPVKFEDMPVWARLAQPSD